MLQSKIEEARATLIELKTLSETDHSFSIEHEDGNVEIDCLVEEECGDVQAVINILSLILHDY